MAWNDEKVKVFKYRSENKQPNQVIGVKKMERCE